MKFSRLILLIIFCFGILFCFGCSDIKVDASSDENLKNSLEIIKKNLSKEEQKKFDEALKAILFSEIDFRDPNKIEEKVKKTLDGKTAKEIIEEGNKLKEKRRLLKEKRQKEEEKVLEEQKKQAIMEIEKLQKEIFDLGVKKERFLKGKEEMQKFKVISSKFYFSKGTFSSGPIIELTVKNGTKYPISRAYFKGRLTSPGRAIAWVEEGFNYEIMGGIEPGEQITWKLAPNMFGEWGQAPKDRNDMILTTEVYQIDDANKEPIYCDYELSELEENLLSLEERKAKLEELIKEKHK